ncbi:MAG: hypothetical protein AAB853_04975, partial [Patescibacteria group bacterium]
MIEPVTMNLAPKAQRTPDEKQRLEENLEQLGEESSARVHRGPTILPPDPEWFDDKSRYAESVIIDLDDKPLSA